MAEVEERQFGSLSERIAALNQQKNFSSTGKRAPPPPPSGQTKLEAPDGNRNGNENGNRIAPERSPTMPARPQKREPAPTLPRRTPTADSAVESLSIPGRRAPPPLPGRTNTNSLQLESSPTLPPRRPSTQTLGTRRGSNASDMSHMSTMSSLSLNPVSSRTSTTSTETQPTRKLPPALDQAKLPPLPPTRREREAQAAKEAAEREATATINTPLKSIKSGPVVCQVEDAPRPGLPPRLPSRQPKSPAMPHQDNEAPRRRLPPPPASDFSRSTPSVPPIVSSNRPPNAPPPVPVSSRPSASQIDALVTRSTTNAATSCLICRDFTQPDVVAAQYPAHSLPRADPVGFLANVLCGPFPSATDKARAIFTWCHHNIDYNVDEFFGKCAKQRRTVEETIFHGKAVCQGYAETYRDIAQRAGLQCVLISGHGKGFGHKPVAPGERPPPQKAGHAWNAVRIDNGEWKLIDPCWGAGHLADGNRYNRKFSPEMFYLKNDLFGLKHFPTDSKYLFRDDGRTLTWEEYYAGVPAGERAQWHGLREGLSEWTFSPVQKHIPVHSNEVIRFQCSKLCEHWDPVKHGKGPNYLLMMKIHGVDGRKDDLVPLDTDGYWFWVDIRARDLGAPGQTIWLYGLTSLNSKDVRGLRKEEFIRAKNSGNYGMSWESYGCWELV
ncbi:uncharacterized protein BCR38DRAFT_432264 [Pseudomassariella vexata]|uniref:Transglutaminase-like domain-containing protein n=1 Tax=Pseudomassariella vexata TaxID=1141098 RepID=A0A1Y2E1R6_9PEZI|nr:uncharacterized protein BCR38DRAFT_432264 [Pseudomassariella vexata]ORY65266.1 hypothetical protein BCR38DRAFT_432264 [Pseudomassariella vexata]